MSHIVNVKKVVISHPFRGSRALTRGDKVPSLSIIQADPAGKQ